MGMAFLLNTEEHSTKETTERLIDKLFSFFSLTIMTCPSAMRKKKRRKSVMFFSKRELAYLSESFHNARLRNYFLTIFYNLFFNINPPHTNFLHAEGILVVTRMQPDTTAYERNAKERAVQHRYLWIDRGCVFMCQDTNAAITLHWLCTLNSIFQGFCVLGVLVLFSL